MTYKCQKGRVCDYSKHEGLTIGEWAGVGIAIIVVLVAVGYFFSTWRDASSVNTMHRRGSSPGNRALGRVDTEGGTGNGYNGDLPSYNEAVQKPQEAHVRRRTSTAQ